MSLPSRMHQRGFTIVELMVAMTLSLILMAGALSILYSSKLSYNENDRLARLQEAGRAAVEMILRDARSAGYLGCARDANVFTRLNNPNALLNDFQQPVYGFDTTSTGTSWAPAMNAAIISPLAGSDVLVLRGSRQGWPVFRTTNPVTDMNADVVVARPTQMVQPDDGTSMIISDCENVSIFSASTIAVAGGTATLTHGAAPNVDGSLGSTFQIGAQVIPVQTTIYYVRDPNDGTGPALYQQSGTGAARRLVEGVENLQVQYGIDTNSNMMVDEYRTADAIAASDWPRVVSISIAMLIRSPDENNLDVDTSAYTLLDQTVAAQNDRRQRAVFVTTVALRNRAS